ncbi:MAG TPA: hypothetical protein VGS27_23310 [Candidatus Sulfotelmatobacter sp.]|nr:hypothetical protein [Candidatus Sulfotelmatobacter sp.]
MHSVEAMSERIPYWPSLDVQVQALAERVLERFAVTVATCRPAPRHATPNPGVQERQSKSTPLSVLVFRIDNVVPSLIRPTLLPGSLRNPDYTRKRRCRGGVGHAEKRHKHTRRQFNMARVDLGRGAKRADVIRNGSYGAPRSGPTATGLDSVGQQLLPPAILRAESLKVHKARNRPRRGEREKPPLRTFVSKTAN